MLTVSADCTPKPSLTIYVRNEPEEKYIIDLLIKKDSIRSDPFFQNDSNDVESSLNEEKYSLLNSYREEGWIPTINTVRLYRKFDGYAYQNNNKLACYYFSGNFVPNTFRIIIITESGKVTATDIIETKAMDSTVYYDYSTGSVEQPDLWIAYLVEFLLTCLPTLLIEGAILLLFGYKLKNNWKPFLLINVLTQLILLFTVGMVLIKHGTFSAVFVQIPLELIIILIESMLYRRYLSGHSKSRAIAYGVAANLISWLLGLLFIDELYSVLAQLM